MSYAEERLQLVGRLGAHGGGKPLSEALRLEAPRLRFHLGTSMADLRVPLHVEEAVGASLRAGVRDLFFLLCQRHRAALREGEYDQLLLLDGFDARATRPVSFVSPPAVAREGVRRAFFEAPELHPALDSGVFASWIGAGRPGRALVGMLTALLRRAAAEEGEGHEPTAYLALLALRRHAADAMDALRAIPVSSSAVRPLQTAVAAGLLVALRLAARESEVLDGRDGPLVEAALSLQPWLGGPRQLPNSGVLAFGTAFLEPPARADGLGIQILQGAQPDAVLREVTAELGSSKESVRRVQRAWALSELRLDLLALLRHIEGGRLLPVGIDLGAVAQLYQLPGGLERILATPERRKELAARWKIWTKASPSGEPRDLLEATGRAFREWREDDPGSYIPAREALPHMARALTALAADLAIERALGPAEGVLAFRTGAESDGGIEETYEAGKLYLVAFGDRPLLRVRTRTLQMAHLFCDVKDFTRRTTFLKETVVADFLSHEFYVPILTAAARQHHGAGHLGDRGGIYLNNLLGDAVSFSGDVVALMELAHDIRSALSSYEKRLGREANRETMARVVASIEERFVEPRARLEAALTAARSALARGVLDAESGEEPQSRIERLEAERARLDDAREAELARATGEKLEAGIFISYGAAPEVARFEDAVFGEQKVSIAEKINESARGTARNGSVRARVEAVLARERASRGRPDLTCPLAVHVAQPLSIPVSAETELNLRARLAQGDAEGALTTLTDGVRSFIDALARSGASGGDIYNGGAAISEEALHAYVEARGGSFVVLRRQVPVRRLHPSIRDRFVFPMEELVLVATVQPDSRQLHELYLHVGRALFKGFEKTGGLGIFEIVPHSSPLFALMALHHLPLWLREHEDGVGDGAEELRPAPWESPRLQGPPGRRP